ncbi:hypothetical protein [Bradyrhizobium sp. McL0616]|uniref:hypothetical protein n=1 Tax=Bradyrhizobium sp. McL0616 TaxID=3415674 RepID=UPI003CF07AC7
MSVINELSKATKTNERREGKLSHAEAASIAQRPRMRRWPARTIWAIACVVAMLGWMSALAWVFWKILNWFAMLG